jgi:hypothetical protein
VPSPFCTAPAAFECSHDDIAVIHDIERWCDLSAAVSSEFDEDDGGYTHYCAGLNSRLRRITEQACEKIVNETVSAAY